MKCDMVYKITDFCNENYVVDHIKFVEFVRNSQTLGELNILESILNDPLCRVNGLMYTMLINEINERRGELDPSLCNSFNFYRPKLI